MFCRHCGRQLLPGSRFCAYCGAPTQPIPNDQYPTRTPNAPSVPPSRQPGKRKIRWFLAPLISILIIAIILCGLYATGVFSPENRSGLSGLPGKGNDRGLTFGRVIELTDQAVQPSGAVLTVQDTQSQLNGLEIKVPAGSYPDTVRFTLSEIAIKENGFERDLIVSPSLLQIDGCDAYSDQLMTVRVPCQVPADCLPVGFFYDPQLKVMEYVPVLSLDANSVTLGLRHFCILGVGFLPLRIFGDIKTYDTGFRPGVDDFNMVNNGSSLEPNGHCSGQCLTMLWYYKNRKLAGEASLWNRFDNYGSEPDLPFLTPAMQDDDVMAIRLASVAHKEVAWRTVIFEAYRLASRLSDEMTFMGIKYAMRLQEAPQYLEIERFDANGQFVSGHAIIAYRFDGDRIYVVDPNYPGQADRFIELRDGKIQPYSSAATAADAAAGRGQLYTRFYMIGLSAIYDWNKIADLWRQFDEGTIGNSLFPDSSLQLITKVMTPEGEKEEVITPGYKAGKAVLEIYDIDVNTQVITAFYHATPQGLIGQLEKNKAGNCFANLKLGDNFIGILEMKLTDGGLRWHHYRWVKVNLPFPYAGTWQGTVHFDDVNLPHPDSAAAAASSGCDQIPLELYNQLTALENTSQNTTMTIIATDVEGKYKATFNTDGELPADPGIDADSIDLVQTDNLLKGEYRPPEAKIVIGVTLEPADDSADKIKGTFNVTSIDDEKLGFFMSIQMTRVKDAP